MILIILPISANILQTALRASGPPRHTDRPAMQYEAVAQVISFLRRHDLPELPLYFGRLFDAVHQADQVAQADAVSICNYGRFPENIAHDQVRALSAHAGKSQQFLECLGDIVRTFMQAEMSLALLGPSPQGRTIFSISSVSASASAATEGNFS